MTEKMGETSRSDIPEVLPPRFQEEQQIIRNKLLMFRFKNLKKISSSLGEGVKLSPDLEPRLRQSARAFITIFAHDEPMIERFKKYLYKYQIKLVDERADTFEGQVMNILWECAADQEEIRVTDIALRIPSKHGTVKPQTIGRVLSTLKVQRIVKRVGDETPRIIVWDDAHMGKLFRRYVPMFHAIVSGVSDVSAVVGTKSILALFFSRPPYNINLVPKGAKTSETDETNDDKKKDQHWLDEYDDGNIGDAF